MGGGGSTSSSSSSTPVLPAWLKSLESNTGENWESAQSELPSIESLYTNTPLEGTAGLTSTQNSLINDLTGYQTGPNSYESTGSGTVGSALTPLSNAESMVGNSGGYLNSAQNEINYLTNPNNSGQTAATQAAMNQFSQETLPTLENTAASAGLGNSGALLESVSQGQNNALLPLLEQQNSNEENSVGQLTNLGSANTANASALGSLANTQAGIGSTQFGQGNTVYSQDQQTLENALTAAGLPQSVAQQEATNLYNQQEQQSQLGQEIQLGPSSNFGIYGGNTSNTTVSDPSKFFRRPTDSDKCLIYPSCAQERRSHCRIGNRLQRGLF